MSDQSPHQPDRNLAEISHLFLSAVRDKTGGGAASRPQRTPPPRQPAAESIDLTPEEFARVTAGGEIDGEIDPPERGAAPIPPVAALIGGHLNGKQFDRAKEYARHLAAQGKRIGLIELDASEFRVLCFDRHPQEPPTSGADGEVQPECTFDPRRMNEVLEELSWDVERWLLVLPTPRVPEARALLRDCSRWVLLSTCDHDGVIACYRALKGLTDLWPGGPSADKPAMSLALLDAPDAEHADRVSAKLTSVCQQFLSWPLEAEPTVAPGGVHEGVGEHLVMCCRPNRDKGQLAAAPQWQIVADFIARSKRPVETAIEMATTTTASAAAPLPETETPIPAPAPTRPVAMKLTETFSSAEKTDEADVIDLPGPDTGESGIVEAILRHCSGELVECPVIPPMCPRAKLAVSRDHRVVLLAVARQGLANLNTIGQAYRWLQENQNLIGMAVPQLSIDTRQPPHLSLLINQADSSAQTLQPMLEGAHVTVKTYRKLRWGGKTGLLLEAA